MNMLSFLIIHPGRYFCLSFFCVIAVSVLNSCLPDKPVKQPLSGTGSFVFTPLYPLDQRPVTVHYFIPESCPPGTPVLMVFHGNERNASEYRDALLGEARSGQVVLLAPEFSEAHYPGNNYYHLGRMFVDGENAQGSALLPLNQWTFSLPDQIYADVCSKNNLSRNGFSAIGHSAGAQFLHRYLMFWPEHEVKRAVISAAGWYNLPDTETAFPHGLKFSPYSSTALDRFLTSDIHLQVGLSDNNPNSSSLRRDSLTDLQGISRLARARYYRQEVQNECTERGLTPCWTYREISGLDHSFAPAIREAFQILFP